MPYFTATFTLFKSQAMALAAVYSSKASLPTTEELRAEYNERVRRKGVGKAFPPLKEQDVDYVNGLLHWVNRDDILVGAAPIKRHTPN